MTRRERLRGLLLGTAVGDAVGLPAEGLSRRRSARLFHGRWRHRLVLGRGMISDDTEHTIFVAQALLRSPREASAFATSLARSLRWWLLALPAGVGLGTLRSVLRLWVGVPPERSGVNSAGNGAAMRSAPIGAFFADDQSRREQFVTASTRITHRDPRALVGSLAVAEVACAIMREEMTESPRTDQLEQLLRSCGPSDVAWGAIVDTVAALMRARAPVANLAEALGQSRGVSGFVYHTVPVAVYAWQHHHGDFRATLEAVLRLGGDTDTSGAITCALAGAVVGEQGIPQDWLSGLCDWPRSRRVLGELADRMDRTLDGYPQQPVRYFWPGVVPRNLLFLAAVLTHGLRRMAPPY